LDQSTSLSARLDCGDGCAARRSLIPAGVAMLALAFLPRIIFYLSFIPAAVIGCVLFYTMCTQVAAGLMTAFDALQELGEPRFDNALMISLPILMGSSFHSCPRRSPPVILTACVPSSAMVLCGNRYFSGVGAYHRPSA
jgi:xanthine/uracil permease